AGVAWRSADRAGNLSLRQACGELLQLATERAGMSMAKRDGQRVGRVGAERPGQIQQTSYHQLYLFLLSRAGSHHGQLHFTRRVLKNTRAHGKSRTQCRAPGLPELQRAVGI